MNKIPVLFPLFFSCSLPLMLLFSSEFQFLDFVAKKRNECVSFFISLNDLFWRFWKGKYFTNYSIKKNVLKVATIFITVYFAIISLNAGIVLLYISLPTPLFPLSSLVSLVLFFALPLFVLLVFSCSTSSPRRRIWLAACCVHVKTAAHAGLSVATFPEKFEYNFMICANS